MLYRMNGIKGNNQSRGKGCMSTVVNNEHKNVNVAEGHLEFRLIQDNERKFIIAHP